MFGKLEEVEIEQVLSSQVVGRIGCNANNTTYIVPISYAYNSGSIYCHTYEGMKMVMMRANPLVCFEVDTMENMGNWKSVVTWGSFEELIDEKDQKAAIDILYSRKVTGIASKTLQLLPQWPFPPGDLDKVKGIVFRIRLDKKTGRFEKSEAVELCGS